MNRPFHVDLHPSGGCKQREPRYIARRVPGNGRAQTNAEVEEGGHNPITIGDCG